MKFENTLEFAKQLDAQDELNKYRNELLHSNDQIYNQEYEPFDVELSNGVYLANVSTDNETEIVKLVKR